MSSGELLGQRKVSVAECLPTDLTFLSEYQQGAWDQIVWDNPDAPRTIQDLQPEAYMMRGLQEELREMTGPDIAESEYSRLGALMMLPPEEERLQPGVVTPTAVTKHLKEFGDISWYLANYLKLFSIPFERTVPVGAMVRQLDVISRPRGTEAGQLELDSTYPWLQLFGSSKRLSDAAQEMVRSIDGHIVRKNRDERLGNEQRLLITSGEFVASMIHVLAARFNTTYERVLQINKAKLEKRIQDGTVFDKSLGEDR